MIPEPLKLGAPVPKFLAHHPRIRSGLLPRTPSLLPLQPYSYGHTKYTCKVSVLLVRVHVYMSIKQILVVPVTQGNSVIALRTPDLPFPAYGFYLPL